MERALIVRKPWIDLILDGKKTWEMRSNITRINERVGLIEQGTGLIVGEVSILYCRFGMSNLDMLINHDKHQIDDFSLLKKWKCAWVLDNAKRYEKPIPYAHPKGAVIWVKLK